MSPVLIAVNLQLVIVHSISTAGFFKFYLGGASLAAIFICMWPTIFRVWGWDPISHGCYMRIADPHQRLMWDLLGLRGWMLLATLICVICTTCVLVRLLRLRLFVKKAFGANSLQSQTQRDNLSCVAWRIVVYPAILSE
jgi:hypothetical protein